MAQPSGGSVGASGNPLIDGLLQGNSWIFPSQPRVITYSFNQTGLSGGSWNSGLETATDAAFAAIEAVANVDFQRVMSGTYAWESSADIAIGLTGTTQSQSWGSVGVGFFPNSADNDFDRTELGALLGQSFTAENYANPEGDIYLDNGTSPFNYLYPSGYGLTVILHEILHAVGIKHPHDDGGTGMPTFAELGMANLDNDQYTVMSYNHEFPFNDSGNPSTPMVLDILALQYIYGANMAYHTGDDVYKFGQDDVYAIWDAGGIDTIDASLHAGIFLKLDAGSTNIDEDSWSTLGIAYGVTIENAIGSNWQDFIWGNEVANTIWGGGGGDNLFGGAGNDMLYGGDANPFDPGISDDHMNGGAGADTLIGGTGNDIYDVDTLEDALEDTFIEEAAGGTDRIFSAITLSLAGHANIEGLTLVGNAAIDGYGNDGDNQLYGNTANNVLWGGDGNDVLSDAVDSDEDVFIGGNGDDIYGLGAGETIVELAGEGTDTVRTSEQLYTLGDNLENLEIYGFNGQFDPWHAIGNALDNKITGSNYRDILDGGGGNDILSGGGSADVYYLDSQGDQIVGEVNGFFAELDEARTWVSIGKSSFSVELFTLLGDADLTCYGNSLDNVITGNAGANYLFGEGGKDKIAFGDEDVVSGGAGKDSFTFVTSFAGDPISAAVTDFSFGEAISWSTLLPLDGAASQISWPVTVGDGSESGLNELEYFSDGITVTLSFGLDDLTGADLFLTLDQWIALADLGVAANGNTIAITNDKTPNQSPTDIAISSSTVSENSANGTIVGSLSTIDADDAAGHTYELLKDADGRFELDGNMLVVAGALDYELLRDHSITVRVTDPSGNSYDETMTVKVIDVNDRAPVIQSNNGAPSATIEINENTTSQVTHVLAHDPDGLGNTPITFSISGGVDKDLFVIDSKTGQLRFLTAPDFENPISSTGTNTYLVEVMASDGTLSDTQTLTVIVKDVANTPYITSDGGNPEALITVAENTTSATTQVEAMDADSSAVFSFAITGGADQGLFKIDSKTGHLAFIEAPDFENPAGSTPDNEYTVEVSAFHGAAADSQTLTIIVSDAIGNGIAASPGNDVINGTSAPFYNTTNEEDRILASGGNDIVQALAGDDQIHGGTGRDTLMGGAGNDHYWIDSTGDQINEEGNKDAADVVSSTITIDLNVLGGGAIEHAYLDGSSAINATGNSASNSLTGNKAANMLDGRSGADTMEGGNGADTYIVDHLDDKVTETNAAAAGGSDLVKSSVSFALGANIEKLTLIGAGHINATGNGLNNTLVGNNGDNRLDGGAGNDSMTGGKGNDTYVVGATRDVVNETVTNAAGGGVDTVESAITYTLATKANVENLVLTGSAAKATGNALANMLTGNALANILDGGTGRDTLRGGGGNDLYLIDNAGDVVEELGSDSDDEARSASVPMGAIAGVEHYTYSGSKAWIFTGNGADNNISGGRGADRLDGADGNDTILANAGNDLLNGGAGEDWLDGGLGNDTMKGGSGNDTYVVNVAGDKIDEEGNSDLADLVRSSVSVNLAALAGGLVENATLLGTAAIHATGNAAANYLLGNGGANILDGAGGADVLEGGKGADTYVIDNAGDQILESIAGTAGGIDLVKSSISYALGANLDKLTLLGGGNIDAIGNTLNNTLVGNTGNNRLDGGAGNDSMTGGKGDDTYVVNSTRDVVSETIAAGGGTDTVESYVTFTLASRGNVENLILTGGGAINGTGNALGNLIEGNSAANKLDGGTGNDTLEGNGGNDTVIGGSGNDTIDGGIGADRLTGGTGRDVFDFDLLAEAGDTVTDFAKGAAGDILDLRDLLDGLGYSGADPFADGVLSFSQSGANTILRVDTDGAGAGAQTNLVTLLNVSLTSANTDNYLI